MSRLGDRLVEHGPFQPWGEAGRWRREVIDMVEVDDLRDELIALRAAVPPSRQTRSQTGPGSTEPLGQAELRGMDTPGPSGDH